LIAAASGWALCPLIALVSALPYAARVPLLKALGAYRPRVRAHIVVAYAVLVAGAVHGAATMGSPARAGVSGLLFGSTLALVACLLAQWLYGAMLREPGDYRTTLRGQHRLIGIATLALSAVHVVAARSDLLGILAPGGAMN
jgi:hypothetical protein